MIENKKIFYENSIVVGAVINNGSAIIVNEFLDEFIPGTKKEGSFVANKIDGDLLTEDEASVLNVQERNSPKIIHIASHSFFLSNKEFLLTLNLIGLIPYSLFLESFSATNDSPLYLYGFLVNIIKNTCQQIY